MLFIFTDSEMHSCILFYLFVDFISFLTIWQQKKKKKKTLVSGAQSVLTFPLRYPISATKNKLAQMQHTWTTDKPFRFMIPVSVSQSNKYRIVFNQSL